ncbi:hypothetical protein HET73_01980 [Wolbachia endosymbiont of Atemnus politus]|nr:hypothetical protein [Wolbachia endosymbiont of Atemnus politus]NSM56376.1 hypothetical protein [Wolbachia endosymbiont of Atemnus politus]
MTGLWVSSQCTFLVIPVPTHSVIPVRDTGISFLNFINYINIKTRRHALE